ncbi:hypothetical protein [Williamsia sterculiae]|uniref:Subtilisin inhibitor-like n=1 Tax=Williamsia sterculiae TaxID=1344003 RepID=A0A1N7F771_9NOCA|nr:hypothetical protein [Williamsia sterculiae]SIR96169.1 hypothetical protein SAMN05445060_1888 [Williamsia sterculiae]
MRSHLSKTARTRSRSGRAPVLRSAAALAGCAAAVTLTVVACGDDTGGTSAQSAGSSTATVASSSGSSPESATSSDQPDPDARAVPGPTLPPATSVPPSKEAPNISGTRCGTANGPEGALRVVVLSGTSGCDVVMPVATEFGPKIALAKPATINGWECGPSETEGVLARCTKGDDAFGFLPE